MNGIGKNIVLKIILTWVSKIDEHCSYSPLSVPTRSLVLAIRLY